MHITNRVRQTFIATLPFIAALSASAHLSYPATRDFGTFSLAAPRSFTISSQTTKAFSWADGTDADFGKQDDGRYFQFTLADTTTIQITATGDVTTLLPAYSIYAGRGHGVTDIVNLDYDTAPITVSYLASLGAPTREGSFDALHTWKIGNDLGTTFADLVTLTYVGHAADGTSANYGSAPGINGDGVADGVVTGSFTLPAGSYTLMVGGANYASTDANARLVSVTVSNVPEPTSTLLMASGILAAGLLRHRSLSPRTS